MFFLAVTEDIEIFWKELKSIKDHQISLNTYYKPLMLLKKWTRETGISLYVRVDEFYLTWEEYGEEKQGDLFSNVIMTGFDSSIEDNLSDEAMEIVNGQGLAICRKDELQDSDDCELKPLLDFDLDHYLSWMGKWLVEEAYETCTCHGCKEDIEEDSIFINHVTADDDEHGYHVECTGDLVEKGLCEDLIETYMEEDHFESALNFCNMLIREEPANEKAYYFRALCSLQLDNKENIIADLKKAFELDPDIMEDIKENFPSEYYKKV